MVTNISSPFIAPDNTLLNVNSTTGLLQLKPGTQGDLLYAGASGVWAALGTGTIGQLLKAGGAGANPSWATVPAGEWNLLATLTPSAVTTITASSLAAYDAYKVVGLVTGNTGTDAVLGLRVNGDSGANYGEKKISGTTITDTTAGSSISLGNISQNGRRYFEVMMAGKTAGSAAASLTFCRPISGGETGINQDIYLGGHWTAAVNTQITSVTVFNAQNFTGVILVYGRNDLH